VRNLVSQLLWHFESPDYGEPSFPRATVDAQSVIEVPQEEDDYRLGPETGSLGEKSVSVQFETENEFGLVKRGHIRLWARRHHVWLQREKSHQVLI
jgi:hypothetical protein